MWNGERIYHPYQVWEDYKNNMWKKLPSSKLESMLQKAIEFTGDHILYGSYMMQAVREWPITCEHNLSDISQNRRAFIGHCACCLAIGCPEDITRSAWGFLTQEQQKLANMMADKAIAYWEENHGSKPDDLFGGDYA